MEKTDFSDLKAMYVNCSLKRSPELSHTQGLMDVSMKIMEKESGAANNDFTNRNTTFMTYNQMHLAHMLKSQKGYPAYGNSRKEWDLGKRWSFENPEYR